jgi:photosystem II stability/assembly factor-like uncharacterized protein
MRITSTAAALAVTIGVAATPAAALAASPAATTFTGWDAPGPLGVGAPSHVAASGTTTAVLGSDVAEGRVPIAVTSAAGSRVGRVAVNTSDAVGGLALAAAGPDRLLLADSCRVRHSEDRGLTWSGEPLAGCSGASPSLTVVDANVAFASTDKRTWRTTDGGGTWTVVNAAERGPALALSKDVGLRTVSAGAAGLGLQRTTDGGASWQGVKVPAPPTDADAAPLADSLPSIAGLARRADGVVLVGAGDAILVSTDDGATFSRRVVPLPDDLPGATGVTVRAIACGEAGGCVVGVTAAGDPARQSALRFDGDAFGARVAALPDADIDAPAADAIVGISRPSSGVSRALRTDDAGATPYRALASGADRAGSIGVHGLLAIASVGRLHVSSDHGASWNDVPLPATPELLRVASAGGKLTALADDGSVRRFADGTWERLADLTAIRPAALAVSGDVPVIVGARGVVRLTDPADPEPVSAAVLQGRGFSRVVARGNTVLAWGRRGSGLLAVRSTDGGKTWKQSKLPSGTDDVQLVSSKVAFALDGRVLYRSKDGGRRFTRLALAPVLGDAGPTTTGNIATTLEFSSATSGVLVTPVGAFVTRDGGRTLRLLPTPGALTPPVAAIFGDGVAVQDTVLGAVFRNASLLRAKAPTLTLRTAGEPKKGRSGTRTVTVVGVLRGAVDDQPVALLGYRSAGSDAPLLRSVTPNADGSFRVSVRLTRRQRGVQAWYRGAVTPDRTDLSTVSKVLAVK